jgi:hypothetical protein
MAIEINADRFYERLERLQTDWMSKKSGTFCACVFISRRKMLIVEKHRS